MTIIPPKDVHDPCKYHDHCISLPILDTLQKKEFIWNWLDYVSAYSTAKEWPTDLLKHHLSRCDGEQ